jgi:hypothetical protein
MPSKLTLAATLEGQRRTWPLEADVVQIGRSSRCPVHLPDATVSKTHAEIVRAGDGWLIRDLGSRNGTRVNGVDAVEPTAIRDGDLLEIGKVMVRVGPDLYPDTTGFAARDLSSSFRRSAQDLLTRPTAGTGSARTMKLLAEAGQLLVLPRLLRETCEEILGFLERALPAQRLVLLLRDSPDAEPTPIASRVRGGRPGEPLAISQSILRVVLDECTSVATNDAARDPASRDRRASCRRACTRPWRRRCSTTRRCSGRSTPTAAFPDSPSTRSSCSSSRSSPTWRP